jgi:molybdopterin molybdotransferase
MLTADEALKRILENVPRVGAERVALEDSLGRVLAESIHARAPMPAFDHSAMDGYAVATSSFAGEGPWSLEVRGESRTGGEVSAFEPGTACRIFTGAQLPCGADAVVMQEQVERAGTSARFARRPRLGDHIRRAGEDLAAGAVALDAGARIGPGQIGLLAALERAQVVVARRPLVTIVCTGDELRAPGHGGRPGSIADANGPALAALVALAGGAPRLAPFASDDAAATESLLREALERSDLVLTVGGVSVGDHDVVRPALEAVGVALDFWKVAIKPGKPLAFGAKGTTRVLGLPGNPVAAQITFALFGAPLLRAMQGDRQLAPSRRRARLEAPARHVPGRQGYLRAMSNGPRVRVLENQASGAATSMAWADCLVVVPADCEGLDVDTEVELVPLAGG